MRHRGPRLRGIGIVAGRSTWSLMESRSFMLPVGLLVAFIASVASSQTPSGAQPSPASVDKIFEAWTKPDAPGCALGVISDGVLVYSAGYGMANIEHGVRNSAGTVFHIASISKQFTPFAIHLLAKSADAQDARRYLYRLTEKGLDLAPVLMELVIWAAKYEQTGAPASVVRDFRLRRPQVLDRLRRKWTGLKP